MQCRLFVEGSGTFELRYHNIYFDLTLVYTEAMEDYEKMKDKNDPTGFEAYSYQPIYILQKTCTST